MTDKAVRREQFVQAALRLAKRDGFESIDKPAIAKEIGLTESLMYHYFKSVKDVRVAVMQRAVHQKIVPIVARGIALGYACARNCDDKLKDAAVKHMLAND